MIPICCGIGRAKSGNRLWKQPIIVQSGVTPRDWMHYMIAVLCHDIGYVKGVLRNDTKNRFATGIGEEMVSIPPEGTDVALTPYHVNRSCQVPILYTNDK